MIFYAKFRNPSGRTTVSVWRCHNSNESYEILKDTLKLIGKKTGTLTKT